VSAALLCLLLILLCVSPADAQAPPEIEVSRLHIFVTRVDDRIWVTEYCVVGNSGDQAYAGMLDPGAGMPVTLAFRLPPGATDLRFDGPGLGERFVELEGGFADTQPIEPGTASSSVLFSYQLPFRSDMSIERAFGAPVRSVVILSTDAELAVEGPGIRLAEGIPVEAGVARSYSAGPLALGDTLTLTLAYATDRQLDAARDRDAVRETAIGLAALAVALPAAYLVLRPAPPSGEPPGSVRALIGRVALLDREFEAGHIAEKAYRQSRRSLKREIRRLL
jgi:hypothetical protein